MNNFQSVILAVTYGSHSSSSENHILTEKGVNRALKIILLVSMHSSNLHEFHVFTSHLKISIHHLRVYHRPT